MGCPLDNLYLAPDGKWYLSPEHFLMCSSTDTDWLEEWYRANPDSRPTEKSNQHVCELINVGFHFEKLVCKICNKEAPNESENAK